MSSFFWRVFLMFLLIAEPLQQTPLILASPWDSNWDGDRQWPWPANDNFVDSGSPLPKTLNGEMANEFDDNNFPTFPNRRWRFWQGQKLKKLQVEQLWQSPALGKVKVKKTPIQWPPQNIKDEDQQQQQQQQQHQQIHPGEPRYPYAYGWPNQIRNLKRKHVDPKRPKYRPSISAGVMTNLGDFFNRLEENVRFAEQSNLGDDETQLLEGKHPHQKTIDTTQHQERQEEDEASNNRLLNAVRLAYRPSQKIRSLVSRNPQGYRGSQFIDPSYMWLGLGK